MTGILLRFLPMSALLTASAVQAQPETAPSQPSQAPAAAAQAAGEDDQPVTVGQGLTSRIPIAVPYMPTPGETATPAGGTGALGHQVAEVVSADLSHSGLFTPQGPAGLPGVSFEQVRGPDYPTWSGTGAQDLVQGYVQANRDGTLTVGCYLYDIAAHSELTRDGFVVSPPDWRRAAHRCADMVYRRLTGEGAYFDSRIVYVAETGPLRHRVKRIAIMDQDGANHRFLTNGQWTVLTPRFAPDQRTFTFMSYQGDRPRVYVYDLASNQVRPLVQGPYMTFAPHYSPDSHTIVFSMAVNGNTDIYSVPLAGGTPRRLTTGTAIDTGGSFSPDGSQIAFESDRSGTQQIYVMNADGSNQHRISFGAGRFATPSWSPRGDLIAFTRVGGGFRVGVMHSDGSGERMLTEGPLDEGPSFAPNGRVIMFSREGGGRAQIWSVDITGMALRRIPTPLDASDPSWSPLRP